MASNRRLVNITRRTFLKGEYDLSAISFQFLLNEFDSIRRNEEDQCIKRVWIRAKITIFLGGAMIIIHENDLVCPKLSIEDFERKLTVISEVVGNAITALESSDKETPRFVDKRFLNASEGISDLYTSTIAITMTETHGVSFEISSCDVKSRIALYGKTAQLKFFRKFKGFIDTCIEDVSKARVAFADELQLDKESRLQ